MALRALALGFVLAVLACTAAAENAGPSVSSPESPWREVKWPFLMDQWGTGRAFQCPAAACGVALTLYLRPKVGFCNCTTGVADDEELDRVSDVDLINPRFAPLAEGRPVSVAHMSGRSRAYAVAPRRAALAIAFNDKCDVVVATLLGDGALPPDAEALALAFLNSRPVLHWVEVSLGQS
jgi:hypothetical protein